MAANIVLVSRFLLVPEARRLLAPSLKDDAGTRYLFDLEGQELLQLRSYESVADLAVRFLELDNDLQRFANHMRADVKRELLSFVEAPKQCASALPESDYLQLRHVEVPPPRNEAYRKWRAETIFQIVQSSPLIEVFLAYHSVISGLPGVMFISGFSGDVSKYQAIFESARYREIVRQAGNDYITGGADGLYTRIYARASMASLSNHI